MASALQAIVEEVQQLPPAEQLALIETISRSLQEHYQAQQLRQGDVSMVGEDVNVLAPRPRSVMDVAELVADWWPEDETADDINAFVGQQRHEDLIREQRGAP